MKNIVLILASVLLNCSAQLLIKKGMLQIGDVAGGLGVFMGKLPLMFCNIFLWAAMLCYLVSIVLWMAVLSRVEVSFAYPFLSCGYVISAIAGVLFFAENVSPTRIAGIVVICLGVILISRS